VCREHEAAFEHLGHDLGRAGFHQAGEIAVVDRAHDHRQVGAQRLGVMQDLHRRGCVGESDGQRLRLRQAGGNQRLAPDGVAVDDRRAAARRLAHALGIVVQRNVRNTSRSSSRARFCPLRP